MTPFNPTVDIIMATYNSSHFLAEQIASLQDQSYANWRLWVRDDGSDDSTIAMLMQFAAVDPRIYLLAPDRVRRGAASSFLVLLSTLPADVHYVMFCDHDDVWLPHKISCTLQTMQQVESGTNQPVLVHSDLTVVDAQLRPISESFWAYQCVNPAATRLSRMIIQNPVVGCTMMINRELLRLVRPFDYRYTIMHDWWLALLASALGQIIAIPDALLLYRQHSTNIVGAQSFNHSLANGKLLRKLLDGRGYASHLKSRAQAQMFAQVYADRLRPEQLDLLKGYGELGKKNFVARRLWLLRHKVFMADMIRNVGLFMLA